MFAVYGTGGNSPDAGTGNDAIECSSTAEIVPRVGFEPTPYGV